MAAGILPAGGLFPNGMTVTFILLALAASVAAQAGNAIEVGQVEWRRDLDAALRESRETGVPVFAFFQEVPGCAGCRKFGSEVMSHSPIVQAIEREFLPVLIYNNRGGADAALLKRFNEPSWNYQVVRFLDGEGQDLIPRKDRVWSRAGIAGRMIEALEVAARDVPSYLEVAAYEDDTEHHATAAFAQHCFWTGEFKLGQIPGVITTEAGWLKGREVTRVRYHTELLSLETLIEQASTTGSADTVFLTSEADRKKARQVGALPVDELTSAYRKADASHQKKQINTSAFARIEMSPMQETKVNSFAPVGIEKALGWLTPEQRIEFREKL